MIGIDGRPADRPGDSMLDALAPSAARRRRRVTGAVLAACALGATMPAWASSPHAEVQRVAPGPGRIQTVEANAFGFTAEIAFDVEAVVRAACAAPLRDIDSAPIGEMAGLPVRGGRPALPDSASSASEGGGRVGEGPPVALEGGARRSPAGEPFGSSGWLIGVPGGPDGLGARVTTLEASERRVERTAGCTTVGPDFARSTDSPALLEPVGVLRHQRVARLRALPIASATDGSLVVRDRLLIRVEYDAPGGVRRAAAQQGPFGDVFSNLLNAAYLPQSGLAPPLEPPPRLERAADATAVKAVVSRDGWVSITGAQLAQAGWDLATVRPSAITVSAGQADVAASVAGALDGKFDAEDRIEFEGRAMTGLFTRENVYWVSQTGSGLRLTRSPEPSPSADRAVSFRRTVHLEEDTAYLVSMRSWEGDDRWLWGDDVSPAAGAPFSTTVRIDDLSARAGRAAIRLRLQGYAHDPAVDPDHDVRVDVNGVQVAGSAFDGPGVHMIDADVAPGVLRPGPNVVTVRSIATSTEIDSVYVNWIDVTYDAAYVAVANEALVGVPGAGRYAFEIAGFEGPEVQVYDVTDASHPVVVSSSTRSSGGRYNVTFTAAVTSATKFRALSAGAARAPDRLEPNDASSWAEAGQDADLIVITHRAFETALQPLVAQHESEGLRTAVVLIDDVYDEFSAGVFDPRSIREFLKFAYRSWQRPAPSYVLLVGEANLDYRRGYGEGPPNYVPSMQFDTSSELTGDMGAATSDLWYGALEGDDYLPEVMIGRISVATAAQAATVVDKTLRFVRDASELPWRQSMIVVADDDGAATFEPFSEVLASTAPASGSVRRFYAGSYPRDQDLTGDIGAAVDEGALAFNFTGHGNVTLWSPWPGGGRIFENDDISALENGDRMPLFTSATCMNGWFDHPLSPVSMAELWLRHPKGGGVVAWTPSGIASLSAQEVMLPHVYRGLFSVRRQSIGALTAGAILEAAGQSEDWSDVIRMFVLFGDPTVVVNGSTDEWTATTFLPSLTVSGHR